MIFSPRESRLRSFRNTSRWLAYLEGTRLWSCGSDPQTGGTRQGNSERSPLDACANQHCHRHRKHSRTLKRACPIWTPAEAYASCHARPSTVRHLFSGQSSIPSSPCLLYDGTEMNDCLKRSCPRCTSMEVFRSHRRGFIERYLLPPLRMRAYRCIKCDTRFYALSHFQKGDSPADKVA